MRWASCFVIVDLLENGLYCTRSNSLKFNLNLKKTCNSTKTHQSCQGALGFSNHASTATSHPSSYPSISAATRLSPFLQLWRIVTTLLLLPRILVAHIYTNVYRSQSGLSPLQSCLVYLAFLLAVVESSALCLVAQFTDADYPYLHELAFAAFLTSWIFYGALQSWYLYPRLFHNRVQCSPVVRRRSLLVKRGMWLATLYVMCPLVGFYLQHHWRCDAGAFDMFALSEYVIGLLNILYHLTAWLDFRGVELCVLETSNGKAAAAAIVANGHANGFSKKIA